jgi:hypothetical protein
MLLFLRDVNRPGLGEGVHRAANVIWKQTGYITHLQLLNLLAQGVQISSCVFVYYSLDTREFRLTFSTCLDCKKKIRFNTTKQPMR